MNNKDFDANITELKKEVQYLRNRYDAPVEVLVELVRKINDQLFLYNEAYKEQKNCNDYLNNELKRRVIPAEVNPNFEVKDKESYLGEVEDVFNVEINSHGDNHIVLTRRVIRNSQDDGSYLQSMVDVLSNLK